MSRSLCDGIGALGPCRFGGRFPASRPVSMAPGASGEGVVEDRALGHEAIEHSRRGEGHRVDRAVAP